MTATASTSSTTSLHGLVWTACMAALISVGAFLQFPVYAVPFTMQPFFVLLAGFVLGPLNGALAVTLYLVAGIAGLPVFAGGKAGIFHLLGPTGGFLAGFLLCAVAGGLASQRARAGDQDARPKGPLVMFLWGLCGLVALFALGILWLHFWLSDNTTLTETALGMLPFFGLDCVKLIAAVAAYRFLLRQRLVAF